MSKRKRRAAARVELALADQVAPVAERHGFDAGGLLGHSAGTYAVNVTEMVALGVDTVYGATSLLADCVAGADVGEWRGTDRLPASRLVRRPMASWTRRKWLWRVTSTLALYNRCYYDRGELTDADGTPLSLIPISPTRINAVGDRVYIDGEPIDPRRLGVIERASWPTLDPMTGTLLRLAREAIASGAAADAYEAAYWENGGAPVVILTTDQVIDTPTAADYASRWVARRAENPGTPAVLGKGLTAQEFGASIGADGAGVTHDRIAQRVARYFRIPAWLLNVPSAAGSLVYSNTESAGLDLVRYTLDGYSGPIEDALAEELPGDYLTGRRVVIDHRRLTMGTMLERYQAYQIAAGKPWMTTAEVRQAENMPPDLGLDPDGLPAPALEAIP